MIGDATDKIANLLLNFRGGHNVLVNPGEITTSQILDFYQIDRKNKTLEKGEDRRSISSYESLTKIENYFQMNRN